MPGFRCDTLWFDGGTSDKVYHVVVDRSIAVAGAWDVYAHQGRRLGRSLSLAEKANGVSWATAERVAEEAIPSTEREWNKPVVKSPKRAGRSMVTVFDALGAPILYRPPSTEPVPPPPSVIC